MWHLLNQPYPCEEPARRRWVKAIWIGAFVGLFLLIFQPFDLNRWQTPYKTVKILGFGLISFVVTAGLSQLLPVLLPTRFTNERWTVGREILWVTTHITLIAVANYFYLNWLIGRPFRGFGLFGMVVVTFLIGIFPVGGSVIVNYIIRLKKYSQLAREIPIHEHPAQNRIDEPEPHSITITAENEKDSLTFVANDLLYIESSDNYSTVVYLKNNEPVKALLRSSLSRLESQLDSNKNNRNAIARNPIVRCHRSYIVNLEKVEKVTGNAQGYKLHLHNGQLQLPVARKYNDTLVAQLKALF
ncbi:LytR/AlgR family response regulator transcription factor [Larkinella rosea]|uniref:LytTR family transcriptional regulator n=1 Tax=Larkinella rosea TaxID=2025312 RepID=A0A3P1BRU8_9BACT|nr:LytTR family DNA-binding domain-containing protein [Larkinella rosea]RRB03792.1 LytTR family transcriptional regulator [Larkinella rosea]